MSVAELMALPDLRRVANAVKCSREWQEALWAHWPTPEQWPGILDVYEAAAYVRVSHVTIRAALVTDTHGKARLRHRRLGAAIRIAKADLDRFGVVAERSAV